METEKEIERRLKTQKDSSKIIIAHRISAVRHADEILILEGGRIIERGTHEDGFHDGQGFSYPATSPGGIRQSRYFRFYL